MIYYIVVVACFAVNIFVPESVIASIFLLGEFGGVPIKFIKLILGLLISMLFIIDPNCHSHPFSLPSSSSLWYAYFLWPDFLSDQVLLP